MKSRALAHVGRWQRQLRRALLAAFGLGGLLALLGRVASDVRRIVARSKIADRRETYNDVVNAHNVRIATLPDMLLAVPLGYRPMPLFEAEDFERSSGRIEFGPETGAGGDQR